MCGVPVFCLGMVGVVAFGHPAGEHGVAWNQGAGHNPRVISPVLVDVLLAAQARMVDEQLLFSVAAFGVATVEVPPP